MQKTLNGHYILIGREFLPADCKNRVFPLKNKRERKQEWENESKWKGTKGYYRGEGDPFQNILRVIKLFRAGEAVEVSSM